MGHSILTFGGGCSIFSSHERSLITINLGQGDPVELAAYSVSTDRANCYVYRDSRSRRSVASSLAPRIYNGVRSFFRSYGLLEFLCFP